MKQFSLCIIAMIVFMGNSHAQVAILVKNGSKSIFRYVSPVSGGYDAGTLSTIIATDCTDGDTLYLPGEVFVIPNTQYLTINKKLCFIGTGIHPDSASAVNGAQVTTIQGVSGRRVYLTSNGSPNSGASESVFHGIKFGNAVNVLIGTSTADENVSGVNFYRCEFNEDVYLGLSQSGTSKASNILFMNCVFRNPTRLYVCKATDVSVVSSVVETGAIHYPTTSTRVLNNLILNYANKQNGSVAGTQYLNNIFLNNKPTTYLINEQSSYFSNLWLAVGPPSFSVLSKDSNHNNTINGVFRTATPSYTTYSYQNDYRLNSAHSKYADYTNLNGNGEVGLYGTVPNTWKDGILPFNPHWTFFPNVSLGSTANGLLAIRVKATAQLEEIAGNKIDSLRYWSNVSQAYPADMKAVAFSPAAEIVNDTLLLDFCDYPAGTKRIYFQLRDTRGQWSSIIYRDVTIVAPPTAFSITLNGGSLTSPYALGMQWYRENGSPVSGASQTPFTPIQSDRYYAVLMNGCDMLYSDTLLFCVPMPVPMVTFANDTLTASAAYAYQWYNSNGAIQGATGQVYKPTANGSYYVIVSDDLGCTSASSITSNVVINGIYEIEGFNFSIYPNPTQGAFTVQKESTIQRVTLTIRDIVGEIMLIQDLTEPRTSISFNAPAGLYLATVNNGHAQAVQKLMIK